MATKSYEVDPSRDVLVQHSPPPAFAVWIESSRISWTASNESSLESAPVSEPSQIHGDLGTIINESGAKPSAHFDKAPPLFEVTVFFTPLDARFILLQPHAHRAMERSGPAQN